MDKDFSNVKRIFFLSDTHLGVRSNSIEWIEIIEDYFENFFIPLVKANYQPGDILVHLGDVFDSRNSLNLRVLNVGISVFEKLSVIFKDGIIIIPGNHDVYTRFSNEINSLKTLKWIPNVYIYEEPKSVKIGSKNFLMMPWRKDHEEEKTCIETLGKGNEYMLCHTDIQGMRFNRSTDIQDGCAIDAFKGFKQVYSGHIHYTQRSSNIAMLGCPYQLTRSDAYNAKGITLLDIASGTETYWENDRSPKFIKMKFTDVVEMSPAKINALFKNNFVDIYIDAESAIKSPINLFLDLLDATYRRVDFHPLVEQNVSVIDQGENDDFDFLKFVKSYIETTPYESATKDKMYDFIVKLHKLTEEQIYQSM
jgi:UDP-2,3-diacylglucosamine pyrophosphatase LpxH